MSYAFIIVAFVAITVKLLFMSFSLYFTMNNGDQNVTQTTNPQKHSKSLEISWKQVTMKFLPKSLYCPDEHNKNYVDKIIGPVLSCPHPTGSCDLSQFLGSSCWGPLHATSSCSQSPLKNLTGPSASSTSKVPCPLLRYSGNFPSYVNDFGSPADLLIPD
ncbi:hypothetical protein MSG28_004102 [Choristoneura fumiferana]|uniref:Uncharacterized protein n=1 Tax=Choristoneura fumiferana TaxID=7141 RepID=A0ACC0KHG6_CHOFU|nr:hypothetical protein MSG28_004102 [Choristoneura fumiferana]